MALGAPSERPESDEMRIGERFPDDESAARFEYPLEFGERPPLLRNFAENEDQIRGVETVVRIRESPSVATDRLDGPAAPLPHPRSEVVDHRLLDVDGVYRSVRFDRLRDRPRVVAGSRPELEDAFAGPRL